MAASEQPARAAPMSAPGRSDAVIAGRLPLNRRSGLFGAGLLVAGLVLTWVSLMRLDASAGFIKYILVAVALGAVFQGLKLVSKWIFGPLFDLGLWLSALWISLLVLIAVFADLLPLRESRDVSQALQAPIRQRPNLFSSHPLGTDAQGLDILGGLVYGARVSLIVGFGAVLIGITVGLTVGLAAGYYRGKLESAVSFLTDSMLAFPPLILLLAMVAVLSPTVANVTVALAVISVPTYIRLARANTLAFAQREFVLSARLLGERNPAIISRELLPNVLLPVVSFSFVIIAVFIVTEASLSFLGLSISRPNPTWGNMIAAGETRLNDHPHAVAVPGVALFLTVFSFNRIGDRARKMWDPREAKL